MKKILLSLVAVLALAVGAFATSKSRKNTVTINTSCGVSIDMIYEKHHTGEDVANDALILEEEYCGDVN